MNPDEEIESIAAEIESGSDPYAVPADLIEEPEQRLPPRRNLQSEIAQMSVGEKLKLAMKGNRDARSILIRDSNRMIQRFVLQNPRITEEEIMAVAKNRSVEREFLEIIARKKEWMANYQIRLALVTNPKTPLALAVRLVNSLFLRDLRQLAKSKNVPIAVNGIAKRIVFERTGAR